MKFFSKKDLNFQLFDVLDTEKLTEIPYFKDHTKDSFDMVIDSAEQIAEKMLYPLLTEMDRQEPQLINGKIEVHKGMTEIIKKFGEDGWINAAFDYEQGGQQLPATIYNAAAFIFQAANYSASVYPFLTTGAANLIRTFGTKELIETFTPKMYSGHWQGTMALTEPDAGSSLTDISTTAVPTSIEGVYNITGQKIYISCGDHNSTQNIIHLMLAKIKGGPLGVKGISLFVVPQLRIDPNNDLIPNDVLTAGVYHKMGYKGAPIAHLMMGSHNDCLGYLVGEPHKGLNYMFQMMNEARIGVGMNAVAIGTAAYYASLNYAKERPQGRKITEKDPSKPQIPIINHADIKRLLLFQKSVVEGSFGLLLFCSQLTDIINTSEGETKENAHLLLDFLTPIAKSYPSEMCCLTTSAAVQILGGAGYTTDFPVEQYYREARIHPIHEGTTAIHGIDLLGRKMTMQNGKAAKLYFEAVSNTIQKCLAVSALKEFALSLQNQLSVCQNVTNHLFEVSKTDTEAYLADASIFLEMIGIITIAWQWLKQGIVSLEKINACSLNEKDFYNGKLMTLQYFYEYEIVKIESLSKILLSNKKVTIKMEKDWF
jgi:alkylation response protein AidB-like acyl-CoA dehydrogenase